jgi:hypothetical protein
METKVGAGLVAEIASGIPIVTVSLATFVLLENILISSIRSANGGRGVCISMSWCAPVSSRLLLPSSLLADCPPRVRRSGLEP